MWHKGQVLRPESDLVVNFNLSLMQSSYFFEGDYDDDEENSIEELNKDTYFSASISDNFSESSTSLDEPTSIRGVYIKLCSPFFDEMDKNDF
jgi:hypothetical protein